MAKDASITLHAIVAEFEKVEKQLSAVAKKSYGPERKQLGTLLTKISAARIRTEKLCPKVQSVWDPGPDVELLAARRRKKPRAK
jgi:hypothetical protein